MCPVKAQCDLQVAEALLGVDTADLGSSFMQLGGDSLAAVQFARGVSDACGVELPVSFVLDHAHSLTSIVDKVQLCICSCWAVFSVFLYATMSVTTLSTVT